MKVFERKKEMKKALKIGLFGILAHICASAALAVTGTSGEFKIDLSGMGSWEMRTARASEAINYSTAWATNALTDAKAVVKVYPVKREKPKYIAIDLSGGTAATHYPIEYLDEIPDGGWTDEYKTSKLVLRHIPAGSFIMGGRATDYPGAVNTNLHLVTLTKDFYIGVFEVTQRQWELVMGNNPSQFTNALYYASRPVDTVSYDDIRGSVIGANWPKNFSVDNDSFIGVLRTKTSLCGFDLPTAAQWELASRAGTTTSLNTGVNLSSEMACEELEEVARYGNNSGWWEQSQTWSEMFANGDWNVGTAKVGSYTPNAFGLYDMHGNVWERVLDWGWGQDESIDPVGAESGTTRVCKGGAWSSGKGWYLCQGHTSSDRPDWAGHGNGLRLCLQGGEIPEVTEGVQLVNAAGEGTANWTPTKAGTYYLTHETQTNGVNGAELLGAWFEVAGPELTFEYDGGPFVGGNVTIGGNFDGWTVYYTTDGSTPTAQSTAYTGPFMLPAAATVKAFAVSDGGIVTDVYSQQFDVAEHARIENVRARQRWPWNGKVDIDFDVVGDVTLGLPEDRQPYLVVKARDNDNGYTYAITGGDVPLSGDTGVESGTHRVTWDMNAYGENVLSSNVVFTIAYQSAPLYCIIDLSPGKSATYYPVTYMDEQPVGGFNTDEYKTSKMAFRLILPGISKMANTVCLSNSYYIGVFELTQKQQRLIGGSGLSYYSGDMRPMEGISWTHIRGDSETYNWPSVTDVAPSSLVGILQSRTGLNFDLPTMKQWEYACRAGTMSNYNNGGDSEEDLKNLGRYIDNRYDGRGGYTEHTVVGMYEPNAWGLYDMHGNVSEWCIDRTTWPGGIVCRPYSAGNWTNTAFYCKSGVFSHISGEDYRYDYIGCRLVCNLNSAVICTKDSVLICMDTRTGPRTSLGNETLTYSSLWDGGDGATVTITQDGAAMVEGLTGEGERAWSVSKTGTYTLSHSTYTNGVVGKVETATFVVPGPELTFEYDGGPFVGGNVTINGNLDGWTVYYTMDGSTPTAQSTAYTGPFMLPAAANVQAFAVSDGGIVTDVYSQQFDVAEHARIENVRARQRWPWNGKVDIDFDVVGDVTLGLPEETYVTLMVSATNRVAGTNYVASIAALSGDMGTAAGAHRVTWDLNAQGLAFESDDVVFSVGYVTYDRYCIVDLSAGANAANYPIAYTSEQPAGGFNTDEYKMTKLVLRLIEPGAFKMVGEYDVILTKLFYIGIFEVTQRQYELITGGNPSGYNGATRPVEQVSWNTIRGSSNDWPDTTSVTQNSVIRDIQTRTGLSFDLPTEAQWEYACRAGTMSTYNNGGDAEDDLKLLGRYFYNRNDGNGGYYEHTTVGSYQPNAWGLYDMHGNVWEWCLDWYGNLSSGGTDPVGPRSGLIRVIRGGAHSSSVSDCGSSRRINYYSPYDDYTSANFGFRLAMTLSSAESNSTICTCDSVSVNLDLAEGPRASLGDETLTYSSLWNGGEGATVTIAQDGATLVEGLTGEGERAWSVTRNGTYVLTHTTYTNGVAGKVETATFVVTGKDVPFAEGDVTVSGYEAKYDGAAHGIGVTVADGIENVAVKYATAANGEFTTTEPTLTDVGSMTVWCEIAAPGYITQTNSATVTITKRAVTLTSGDASKVYDGTALVKHEVAVSGDGFVNGEGANYEYAGSQIAVGTSENTFTYTLNDGTKAGNYDITTVNGTLTVTKATVGPGGGGGDEPGDGEVPQGGESKFDTTFVYDGEGHTIDTNALTAAFGAAMIGEFAVEYAEDDGSGNGVRGAPALPWGTAPVYTNAGEYVVWYRVSNPNYNDFIHAAKVTITNRPVTVTVVGHTATYDYDTTEKTVAGCEAMTEDELYDVAASTTCGGALGDRALPGGVVFDGVAAVRTDVGTTAMGLAASDFANNDANFLVTYEVTDGWVKVEPRVIGDDPANWDIRLARNPMYDGTLQTAPITQVAFVKPDGNLDNIPYTLSGNTATDAGNYVVRITGTGNYSGTVEKEWAITPRNVTLTSGSAEWVYDGTAHSETAVTVGGDGFADGEGASYSGFPVVRHVSDAAAPTANAFTYALNANTKAGNYSITTANGTVKMLPRAITLTAPTKSKPYDGTPLTFGSDEVTAALNGEGGALGERALPEGEAFSLGNFSSITEAGRVDATFTVADGTALTVDYAITTVPGALTVTRSATEITVIAKSGSWTYDGQPHSLHEYEATNLGTLQAGDALEVTFDDASVVTTPLDGPEGNGVVANVITGVRVLRNGTDDVTANYTLAPYNGTLTVTRRPVTLTSKSDTKAYDGEPLAAHEVTVGGDGFVGEDGATYDFTGSQTEKGTSKNAFSYTLKSGTNAAHYDITKVEGDLEVTAADISAGTEEDWQITFGPALTYTGLEQIQTLASVTYKGLPLDYSVTGNAQTDAGTYQMALTGQGNFSGTHQVAWSIAPKALTLTAGSGSRVYDGTAFKVGTVTASGFVAGEGAEYECTGSQKDVGSSANEVSAIGWNANTKASNYAVTKVAGTLTVTPRPATLTAANLSKPYDGTPLALTAADIAASGIVAGESFTYSDFASRTEAGQTPATFSYAAGPGTSLANYAVTVTAGRMITITKSATAISVTAASESWTYDGEAHSNRTWTATNLSTLQSGDELEVTFDEASVVTTPQDGPAHDGVVANVITGVRVLRISGGPQSLAAEDVTANYSVEWFPGTLAVTKRPVTVTVTGRTATSVYDGEEKSVAGYDIAAEDSLYDIAADTVFGGVAATNRTDAGKSDMGLKAADFTNNDDCFDVTYAVTDGWVKIDPLDIAAAGDEFALMLGANPKYNGTVQTISVTSVTCGGLPVTYTLAGENATHAGTYTLTVKANGNFTGERSTTWQMLKRAVTLTSGSASKVYDGTPLANPSVAVGGDGFIGIEGATFNVTGSQTVAGTGKNTFAYTLKAGTLVGDYEITKVEGDLTVTKASTGGEGGDEPGGGEVPEGGESKFDVTAMYDGEGHTIDTNALVAAFGTAMIGEFAVEYAVDDGSANGGPGVPALPWGTVPVYTNAGAYVVWYRVSNPNYEDFIHAAKVTITNRPVTVTSADGSWTYDGQAHSNATVTAEGFVDGEGIVAGNFTEIVDVGTAANAFTYAFADGTLAENYAVTCVTGTLTVVAAGIDGWTDDAKWSVTLSGDGAKYDGTEKTCEVTALAYDGFTIPTFTVTGNTATDAGDYTLTVTGTGNFSGSHTSPWSITKRAVTLTSGDASKVYDGIALTNHTVSASGDGFIDGEGASYNFTGSQTSVGTSENTFTYTLNDNTKAGNYDITTVNGTLTVTPATLNPADVFGGDAIETPLVCEKVFNGAAQPVEIVPNFDEPYKFLWALTEGNENAYSATAPTLRNVADGELTVFFKFVTANYEPYYGKVVFRIVPKTLTDEMVVLSDVAFYYDPGSTVKNPSVTVADTNALGEVISTANDYTVAYENATAAGAIPVTVTAKNNYTGTVTKTFPVLKRPVPPPTIESTVPNVVSSKSYNGKKQVASIPADERWTVVSNPGGVNAGFYTNVVLRLTNPDDYRWKGVDEAEAEWTGVFEIRRANNGWSRYPGIQSWTYGETPNEPVMGQARQGTVQVAYRRKGTDVSTETATKPSTPGVYIARFWVDATENYIGVALSTPYEVEFEIAPGAGGFTETQTTPVPVPYVWLDPYLAKYGSGDYETAGKAKGRNGCFLWESYVAGLDPEDPTSKFTAVIELLPNGAVKITWSPDLSTAEVPRTYTTLGKANLTDKDWVPVTDANKPQMRFFRVKVEIK